MVDADGVQQAQPSQCAGPDRVGRVVEQGGEAGGVGPAPDLGEAVEGGEGRRFLGGPVAVVGERVATGAARGVPGERPDQGCRVVEVVGDVGDAALAEHSGEREDAHVVVP